MSFDGMSLTNTRDIKCNNIYLNYNNDMKNILEIFSFKSDISNITGLPPETLNTLQELASAMNNNPDFFNYVNQQLILNTMPFPQTKEEIYELNDYDIRIFAELSYR